MNDDNPDLTDFGGDDLEAALDDAANPGEDTVLDEAAQAHKGREMLNGFKPTDEQARIFAALEELEAHLSIEAYAGTGKTATIVEGTHRHEVDGIELFLAFNKHVERELSRKLPEDVWCKTFHGYGLGLIQNEMDGGAEVDAKRKKSRNLIYEYVPEDVIEDIGISPVRDLTDKMKAHLADETEHAKHLIETYGIEVGRHKEVVAEAAPPILVQMAEDMHNVEFSDMVWQPVVNDLWTFPKKMVYVDEAQDLNPCQHELVARLLSRGGRMVAVGDRRQAIYSFRGADERSMDHLTEKVGSRTAREIRELPLTMTFRCPQQVVELAQQHVPDYEAFRSDPGTIRHTDPLTGQEEVAPGDVILCRKNSPIINYAYQLIASKTPAMILGRDVGRGLEYTIERVAGQKNKRVNRGLSVEDFIPKLNDWLERELDKLDEDDDSARQKLRDRYECIQVISRRCGHVGEMLDFIDDTFGDIEDGSLDPERVVTLSTVHKAKGKEWDRVFILEPSELDLGGQGANIAYVAVTRTKEELVLMGPLPDSLGGGEWISEAEERYNAGEPEPTDRPIGLDGDRR